MLRVLPGKPDDLLDVVSAHVAAEAICELFEDHFQAGTTYAIASGRLAPTLGALVELVRPTGFEVAYTGHSTAAYHQAVAEIVRQHPDLAALHAKIDSFITYLAYPKVFDVQVTQAALSRQLGNESVLHDLRKRFCYA